MFRENTNQKAVFDFLSAINPGEEKMFDVADVLRPGDVINDVMARVYISSQSKIIGSKFRTKCKSTPEGQRLFVKREAKQ